MGGVVGELREQIFRRWGAVSALALPCLIPLGRWPEEPAVVSASRLASFARAGVFELERHVLHRGYHFLAVRSPALEEIRALVASERGPDPDPSGTSPSGAPPSYPGFFLAGPDLGVGEAELERVLPLPAERRFRSYAFSLLEIDSASPPERWWDLVGWEETLRVPVKTSGRPSPGSGARER